MDVNVVTRSIASPFNIRYLNDATLAGPVEALAGDLRRVIPALSLLDLEINSVQIRDNKFDLKYR